MSKQLINKLFSLVNSQPVSSRDLLSLIYKHLEKNKELKKFPALQFARHLQNHSSVSRDPVAYESLLKMVVVFLETIKTDDYSPFYKKLTNSALPMMDITLELDSFCFKIIKKRLSAKGFHLFILDFLQSFDDETLVFFDPKSDLYKKTNIEKSLQDILDTQTLNQSFQITKLNKLVISRGQFWGRGESIIIGIDVNTLTMPKFNETIIQEFEGIKFQFEFARIK